MWGAVGLFWGYLRSRLRDEPRYDDLEFRRFLRRYQHASMVMGKAAATRRVNRARAAAWYAKHGHEPAGRGA